LRCPADLSEDGSKGRAQGAPSDLKMQFWGRRTLGEVKLALLFEARAGIALVQGLEGDPVLVTIVLSVFVEADEGEGRPERASVPAQGTG